MCAYLAASSCEFFSYESKEPESLPGPFLNLTAATVGIFSYFNEDENECTNYDEIFTSALDANDFNAYFVTAQFAAVIGPACAAVAWLINLVEWLFWSNTCTYQLVVLFLIFSFAMQGITFMVYGQTEFW